MSSANLSTSPGLNARFFAQIVVTWAGFTIWQLKDRMPDALLVLMFALGSAALSICILHFMDYFSKTRLLPRQSDLFLIMAALPLAGVLQYGFMILLFKRFPIPLTEIWFSTPLAAVVIFGTQYLVDWRALRKGQKKMIVLELLPNERAALIAEFQDLEIAPFFHFLTPSDLKEAFLRGTEHEIDQIIISRGAVRELNHGAYLIRAHLAGIPIVDRRALCAELSGRIRLQDNDSWSYLSTATQQTPVFRAYSLAKIFLEPVLAFFLAIALAPLMAVVAVLIKWDSRGPVFYRQLRTGYLGETFSLIKFRSMTTEAETTGPQWAKAGDNRVTKLGAILRKLRIDELPQLWNVMRGEMSFVGPRPERPEFYHTMKEAIPLFSMRTTIRPGITGWAQVCAGYAASVEESRTKLEYDLYYIKHVSPRLDLIVLFKTIKVALMGSERAQAKPRHVERSVVTPPMPTIASVAAVATEKTLH